jgi:drug/metabolite transporter (DMT)-like permease
MNWKTWFSAVFDCSILLLVLLGWDYLNGKVPHFSGQDYIKLAILGVALSVGSVGLKELVRGGHRKVRRKLLVFIVTLLVIPFTLLIIRNRLHWKMIEWNFSDVYLFLPFYALFAAIFPLSLYLNRNLQTTPAQPTVPNAP